MTDIRKYKRDLLLMYSEAYFREHNAWPELSLLRMTFVSVGVAPGEIPRLFEEIRANDGNAHYIDDRLISQDVSRIRCPHCNGKVAVTA